MFGMAKRLKEMGVLAINRRNADYTLWYNPRRLYPLVDDKLRTKELALKHGIAVPELYGVIEVEGQVRSLGKMLGERTDFVVKPAHGSGGEGILVISGRVNERFRKADGTILVQEELEHHIFSTLSGLYSLGGQPDKALIEYRVQFDPVFEKISYQGVPDIRIIVFLGVPVMSMVRLPTRKSDGKANLHQGAVGAGIDISTGMTLNGVWDNLVVTEHPDTGAPVRGNLIPDWDGLLDLAARCYEITGLGYQGVDIVLDRDKGPLILEINARPGLNIQIANNAGLLPRLDLVKSEHRNLRSVAERVQFAKDHFAVDSAQ
ncbi:MAG: alpha-L-glutamate ligase-like protein [Thermodesulfobacteriota bacterium]